jgi:hypothetical protein
MDVKLAPGNIPCETLYDEKVYEVCVTTIKGYFIWNVK